MKKILHALASVLLFLVPNINYGQTPSLGSASNFVLFSSVGAVTNTGISQITGNVGTNVGSSTGFGNVNGVMDDQNGASLLCTADLLIAYNELDTATPNFFISTTMGNNDTLIAGVYRVPAAASLGSNLILNAQGNAGAVFIFQVQGALSVAALSKIVLINGAQACNVFWKIEGLVDVATGTTMRGTIIAHNAAINMNALDTLEGRALSITGAVTVNGLMAYTPLGCGTPILQGPAAPDLLSTKYYGLFSSDGPVSNTGITHVIGDVGTNVGLTTGFDPLLVTGMIHLIPDPSTAQCASDLTLVYNYLEGLTYDIQLLYPAQFGHNLVLTPHTYLLNAATALTDSLYLNAEGNSNAVFVIQINGALSASSFSRVILINGARSKNVYWKVDGAVTIADSSLFSGTLIVNNAAILFNLGTMLNGRALTTTGAVTINGSTINGFTAPDSGSITGSSTVCVGSSVTLSDNTSSSPGVWSITNSNATITSAGVVTGVTTGPDTVKYTVTDPFGTTVATWVITINPLPNAGTILGNNTVCLGSTLILTDATTGGAWSSTNNRATIISGTVTPVSSGLDTIQYIVSNTCGNDTARKTIAITVLPNAGTIIGANAACIGTNLILSDLTSGGIWGSSNATATVNTGTVTPVSPGIDTIRYMVTNTCGTDTAIKIVTITPLPNAGTILGSNTACLGTNLVLTDATSGGNWSTSNATATVTSGTVTPVSAGIDTIRYIISNACGNDTALKIITISTLPNAGTILGASTVCMGSVLVLNDLTNGGSWSSSNALATVSVGTVTPANPGTDTIRYRITNTCGSDTALKIITINPLPNAGVILGGNTVCISSSLVLTDATGGGTWISSNATATVTSGTVTPVSTGIDTIGYKISNACGNDTAFKIITISTLPNAGTISGASTVCMGSVLALNDLTGGGSWSSSNALATVSVGTVTPVNQGTDTIRYIVSNACGNDTATKIISINPLPNAGTIFGENIACLGSDLSLNNFTPFGTWSSSNGNATVILGTVSPVSTGLDTIRYMVSNICGTDTASFNISILTTPTAGVISGDSYVCLGFTTLLTDPISGGVWSVLNPAMTVSGGLVTAVTMGTDTIYYKVINACGSDSATAILSVNPLPNAGIITGDSIICIGSAVNFTETVSTGVWSLSNTNATIAGNTVTGVSAGLDTLRYLDTNLCGTDFSEKFLTINPLPIAGAVVGASGVCIGSVITLSATIPGGTWSATNGTAAILDSIISGVTPGQDTILYTISNACGADTIVKPITIFALPVAGTINGASTVCIGTATLFVSDSSGGNWSVTNANGSIVAGLFSAISLGIDTIRYEITTFCGTDTTSKTISIITIPEPGTISGPSSVCVGSMITLIADSTGGTWTSEHLIDTVISGNVIGITPGYDTVYYSISNMCGAGIASKPITVNPLPFAGYITGLSGVCVGSSITLADTINGGIWISNNVADTIQNGVVFGLSAGTDTIRYTVTNICGADTASSPITINPLPFAGSITGQSNMCVNGSITLVDTVSGGTWTNTNAHTSVTNGVITGLTAGIDTIMYMMLNICGTDTATKILVVNPLPFAPPITTQGPSVVCAGTMYQNFGTSTAPPTGIKYAWSASNATVWATSYNGQNALISFENPGIATVVLADNITSTQCRNQISTEVTVNSSLAPANSVIYFEYHFVCTPNNEDSYQWGYDDATTLDSTLLTGEINQDYLNSNPDFTHKYYWVMTSSGSCNQKTYLTIPTAIVNVNTVSVSVDVFPNPAGDWINLIVSSAIGDEMQLEIQNVNGQKVSSTTTVNHKSVVNATGFASGFYIVNCIHNGTRMASTRFIKN